GNPGDGRAENAVLAGLRGVRLRPMLQRGKLAARSALSRPADVANASGSHTRFFSSSVFMSQDVSQARSGASISTPLRFRARVSCAKGYRLVPQCVRAKRFRESPSVGSCRGSPGLARAADRPLGV